MNRQNKLLFIINFLGLNLAISPSDNRYFMESPAPSPAESPVPSPEAYFMPSPPESPDAYLSLGYDSNSPYDETLDLEEALNQLYQSLSLNNENLILKCLNRKFAVKEDSIFLGEADVARNVLQAYDIHVVGDLLKKLANMPLEDLDPIVRAIFEEAKYLNPNIKNLILAKETDKSLTNDLDSQNMNFNDIY